MTVTAASSSVPVMVTGTAPLRSRLRKPGHLQSSTVSEAPRRSHKFKQAKSQPRPPGVESARRLVHFWSRNEFPKKQLFVGREDTLQGQCKAQHNRDAGRIVGQQIPDIVLECLEILHEYNCVRPKNKKLFKSCHGSTGYNRFGKYFLALPSLSFVLQGQYSRNSSKIRSVPAFTDYPHTLTSQSSACCLYVGHVF